MAKNEVTVRTGDTILNELEQLQRNIRQRAYELFTTNGGMHNAIADWLSAERQTVWKPAIELRRKDGEYEVLAATAGVPAKDLDVKVTPEDLLIKGHVNHRHQTAEGDVQVCEFESGELFRSIHFPERIDPDKVKAEYKDGMLHVTAKIATPAKTTAVPVTA